MTAILAIETSCDETAAAVVTDGTTVHSNIVASQIDLHAQYGGVFPELASRAHAEAVSAVVARAMGEADMTYADLDAIAVTQGPGLVGSLLVGIHFAKGLALTTGLPLLGINHLEGHVYSLWLAPDFADVEFPVLVAIVSGGHSELILMQDHGRYRERGTRLDDAAGEAFDKVGRLLGLPYPGGPAIERAAETGKANAYKFPRPGFYNESEHRFDFSFSGLKTAVMRAVTEPPVNRGRRQPGAERRARLRADVNIHDVAAAFQDAITDSLANHILIAARNHACKEIFLCGGVSANTMLRQKVRDSNCLPLRFPPLHLCTDNAAMIGAAAYFRYRAGHRSSLDFEARANWRLSEDVYAD